jgi:branched-subunit amino acid transport protein
MLFFCMSLGLIASKTMSEALSFIPLSVLGYAIDNNLLGAHGWSRVQVLAQKTPDDRMLEKIKRRVGQME